MRGGSLIDEILSSVSEKLKSAPEEAKIACTALKLVFGNRPIEDLIFYGKRKSERKDVCFSFTREADELYKYINMEFIDFKEKGIFGFLIYLPIALQWYAMAKAYDENEEVRRRVKEIEESTRTPEDVRKVMNILMKTETRTMFKNAVKYVFIKPLEEFGDEELLREVKEHLNKLVDHTTTAIIFYGKFVNGELVKFFENAVHPDPVKRAGYLDPTDWGKAKLDTLYSQLGRHGKDILYFGYIVKKEYLVAKGEVDDEDFRWVTRTLFRDWEYRIERLYEISKEIVGKCTEVLEKYAKQTVVNL